MEVEHSREVVAMNLPCDVSSGLSLARHVLQFARDSGVFCSSVKTSGPVECGSPRIGSRS